MTSALDCITHTQKQTATSFGLNYDVLFVRGKKFVRTELEKNAGNAFLLLSVA